MPNWIAHTGLPPSAYFSEETLKKEKECLLESNWQWAGLCEDLAKGIKITVAGIPVIISGDATHPQVCYDSGLHKMPVDEARAELCGRFVFVQLRSNEQSLEEYLGAYTPMLLHCSENFDEIYDAATEIWNCNWKAVTEVALEGYHVPYVHAADAGKSNLVTDIPEGLPPTFNGPHSYQCGVTSEQMKAEMSNIAKRLKISQSKIYNNYDHYTLFPNMSLGISGGCLCFIQIFDPIDAQHTSVRYIYFLAKLTDPNQKPVSVIRETLLNKWRNYTKLVMNEDKVACELFQQGVPWARSPGFIADKAEVRVHHFQDQWRDIIENKKFAALKKSA